MSKKLNKNRLLVNVSEPFYVRHQRNEKHNEVTVVVLKLALPLGPILSFMTASMVKAIDEVSNRFPDADLTYNYDAKHPAILFTVKGKTECRGNDTPNQKIGDIVAMAKAQSHAGIIVSKVLAAISKVLEKSVVRLYELSSYFDKYSEQERCYIESEKYLKSINRAEGENKEAAE